METHLYIGGLLVELLFGGVRLVPKLGEIYPEPTKVPNVVVVSRRPV